VVLGVRDARQARALRTRHPGLAQVALIDAPREIEAAAAAGAGTIRLKLAWLAGDASLAARVRRAGARVLVLAEGRGEAAVAPALVHAPEALLCDDPAAALALARRSAEAPPDR
jgi:hypothetical protein